MNRKLITLLLSVITSVGTLFAYDIYDVQVGDLYYLLDEQSKTATVTYKRWSEEWDGWNAGFDITTANIPESITPYPINGQSYRVVAIGEKAFYNCKKLASVTIPNSVTTIGLQAFRDCEKLTSLNIGEGVTEIGESAFRNCNSLIYLIIPDNVTSIGESAFSGCSSLNTVVMSEGVTSIGREVFQNCSNLQYIRLSDNVTSIEDDAFRLCSSLEEFYIPYAMNSISEFAFYDTPLKHIIWGARNCHAYNFGNQVEQFEFCGPVEVIPNGLCKGMNLQQSYIYYPGSDQYDSWINIPNTVKVIGDSAFFGSNLQMVYIGTELETWCLYQSDNTSLLDSIGKDAFSNCTSLQGIECWATTPPALGEHVFNGITCSEVTLKVPYKSERAYRDADQWKEFFIEMINPPSEYTITFKNWDGSVLQEVQTPVGKMPQYTGETPTRESDGEYDYIFNGWEPKITAAVADAIYIATYTSVPVSEGVENTKGGCLLPTKEIRDGKVLIHRGKKTYTVQGQEIKEP